MVAKAPRLINWPRTEIRARPGFLPIVLGPVHMVSADNEEAAAVLGKTEHSNRLTEGSKGMGDGQREEKLKMVHLEKQNPK